MKTLIINFILMVLSISCTSVSLGNERNVESTDYPLGIKNIIVVVENGNRASKAIIEFHHNIKNKGLSRETFHVEGYEVTRIYANNEMDESSEGKDGNYIIIELNKNIGAPFTKNSKLKIIQKGLITVSNGERYKVLDKVLLNNGVIFK